MKTLLQKAVDSIDKRFNPRIEGNELIVNVPGEKQAQIFFKEDNNEVKLTDNFRHLAPEEFNVYLIGCESSLNYKPMKLEQFMGLVGKRIDFFYADYDNGPIEGKGIVNSVNQIDSMRYKVDMNVEEGEALNHIYLYGKDDFVMAGDDGFEVLFKNKENKQQIYVIKHASKGYLLWNKDNPGIYWGGYENRWKQRFHSIEEAEKMAKTLKSLDGNPLKRVEIVEMLEDGSPFGFERAIVHKVIEK